MDLPLPKMHKPQPLLASQSQSQSQSQCGPNCRQFFGIPRSPYPLSSFPHLLVPHSSRNSVRILRNCARREVHGFQGSPRIGLRVQRWGPAPILRRRKIGIAHFEQGERDCGDGNATSFEDGERPPFDLDLAVVLAGFAFEAYNTPAKNMGVQEKDAGDCETTYLALNFLREVYDGQLIVKLKKGMHFPALDFWGTSDPYVVLRCGDCEAQSRVVWATRDPVWNEEFKLNVKDPESQYLKIAAWDANVVTSHRRMGNTGLSLLDLSDGKKHEVELQLGGMGGGGAIQIEVQYQSFEDSEKSWFTFPSFNDLLQMGGMADAYKSIFGDDGIRAGDFVRSTLGSLPFLLQDKEDNTFEEKAQLVLEPGDKDAQGKNKISASRTTDLNTDSSVASDTPSEQALNWFGFGKTEQMGVKKEAEDLEQEDEGDYVRTVVQAVGKTLASLGVDVESIPVFDKNTTQADREAIYKLSSEFQSKAEADYVENGLALPSGQRTEGSVETDAEILEPMSEQLQSASKSMLQNTESFLGMWATVARSFPGSQNEGQDGVLESSTKAETGEAKAKAKALEKERDDGKENEAKRQMFQTAESAVEAWAMLATSLGGQSFVKSEFEKICFLENRRTDTEVAIWRDSVRHRLLFAFRGTEQTKWKDLSTDMNVIPVGFNPERIGGDFNDVMVHGGFLNAYDSVRRRLMNLLKSSLGISDVDDDPTQCWQVYSTGHSLGGALATLFALELSSSKLAKKGHIQVTMYNFGSPRVGNKLFADTYNQVLKSTSAPNDLSHFGDCALLLQTIISTNLLLQCLLSPHVSLSISFQAVKDSWRVVNHRDIIPTVPRLMGYCHVAQPVYLSAGDLADVLVDRELLQDGYHGDVIGEVTPDFVFENVMKGERKMLERLVQTEIAMLRAIRDGSALMQHMEDFYYIALLERVEKKMARRLKKIEED